MRRDGEIPQTMRVLFNTVALAVCMAAGGCGNLPRAVDGPRSPDSVLEGGASCTPFQWIDMPGVSERAAIRLPVEVDGRALAFQLDTGTPTTILYDDARRAKDEGWPARQTGNGALAQVPVRLAGIDTTTWVRLRGRQQSAFQQGLYRTLGFPVLDGTVGLDLLEGRVTAIDFPNQLFCVLGSDVPQEIERRIAFAPAELRDGKLFVGVEVAGESLAGILYDTGSSRFDLIVDRAQWTTLTGRTGEEPSNVRMTVASWGQPLPLVGAPARGALSVGPVVLDDPVVFYRSDRESWFSESPSTVGLIGNAPFWDHVIVLDLRVGQERFGVVR